MNSYLKGNTYTVYWHFILFLFAMGVAIAFFFYGSSIPYNFRVRGDANEYLRIASRFSSLKDALHYIAGFPLVDFLFIHYGHTNSAITLVNRICWTLFLVHELTIGLLCWIFSKLKLFPKHSLYYMVLFFLLAAYPALVMHTTTPLTDTFGMDLLLLVFIAFALIECGTINRFFMIVLSGLIGGLLLGYAVLVRPVYLVAAISFLIAYFLIMLMNRHTSSECTFSNRFLFVTVVTIAFSTLLLTIQFNCQSQNSSLCQEHTKVFHLINDIQDGLVGSRVLWNLQVPSPSTGVPVLPDPFMIKYFYSRCSIVSVVGISEQSLVGCLLHNPFASVVYLLKKSIGLFDAFRLTPYTESMTPSSYVVISRIFSSLTFVGFLLALFKGLYSGWRLIFYRQTVSTLFASAWIFCLTFFSIHVLLHIEERYIFPCIPLCLTVLLLQIHYLTNASISTRQRWGHCILAALLSSLFFMQILNWDSLSRFY
ncbi:hypothetical protein [Legionella sp.]|uniref:hypothetical protein n=1 Tax=Legionella sp. TaxID=459 RepID=UPI003C85E657